MHTTDHHQEDHTQQNQHGTASHPKTLNKYIVLPIISSPAILLALVHMRHLTSFFEKNAEQTVLIVAVLAVTASTLLALGCL